MERQHTLCISVVTQTHSNYIYDQPLEFGQTLCKVGELQAALPDNLMAHLKGSLTITTVYFVQKVIFAAERMQKMQTI